MNNTMQPQEWYPHFLEQCNAIIVETISTAREMVLKGKWELGELIIQNWEGLGGNMRKLSRDLGVSAGEVNYWVIFREKHPDFEKFMVGNPWGKNVSWHKVSHWLLPEGSTGRIPDYGYCPLCKRKLYNKITASVAKD